MSKIGGHMTISKKLSLLTVLSLSVSGLMGITKASDPVAQAIKSNKTLAVFFTMPGCKFCPPRKALFNQLRSYKKNVVFMEVSVNQSNKNYFKSTYGFSTVPTIAFFKNGKKVTTYIGQAIQLNQMKKTVDNLVR